MKPSDPYCGQHGDVEAGHRVTLTCHSVKGNPAPTYTWKHLEHGKTLGVQGHHTLPLCLLNMIIDITSYYFISLFYSVSLLHEASIC